MKNTSSVSNSVLEADVVLNKSWVTDLSTIGSGVQVTESKMLNVSITENKTNNSCSPDNINEPEVTRDDQGNIVDYNWCFHPLYFPEW